MTRAPYDPHKPLDGLTRRGFLQAAGLTGAAAALAGCSRTGLDEVMGAAQERPLPGGTPILVLVTLYGGNDSLGTLVPYADPAYRRARPDLAWGADEVHRLDDELGLNPGLKGLADLWGRRKLSIVRGVGYPRPDHSHFRSMDIWQTASPDRPATSGWIGRWLDHAGADPLLALNVGTVLPPLAVGENRVAAALSTRGGGRAGGVRSSRLHGFAIPDHTDGAAARAVVASYAAMERVERDVAGRLTKGEEDSPQDAGEATVGGDLGRQLDLVARCIRAGAPTRVYCVQLGGFDTHADEREAHQGLLTEVDAAITGFRAALAGHARERDVVLMAYSEFGRRVAANGSDGTDHGTAGTMLLVGDRVAPGFHGEQPSLTDLDDGDLKVTTDFRSVYAEVVHKVLGSDPGPVVLGAPREVGALA